MIWIITILCILFFVFIINNTSNKIKEKIDLKKEKFDTNFFTNSYYNPNQYDLVTSLLDISKLNDSELLNILKKLDYLFNDSTLQQLIFMKQLAQKDEYLSTLVDGLIRLKENQNRYFEKYPKQKPDYYRV